MQLLVEWIARFFRRPVLMPAFCCVRRVALVLGLLLPALTASAQVNESSLGTLELEQIWQGQFQLPLKRGTVASTHLWTNPNIQRTYAEITFPVVGGFGSGYDRTIRVPADRLDRAGKPIGIEAAMKEAEVLASRVLGRPSGVTPVPVTVPVVYLIAVTTDGFVQAMDAETGKLLWSNSAGDGNHPASPASVSDEGVAVVHGTNLVLFDLSTGKQVGSMPLKHATAWGVALVGSRALVPSFTGQVMVYDFSAERYLPPRGNMVAGRPVGIPIASGRDSKLAALATDRGNVTVFDLAEGMTPVFNFRGKNPVVGPISFSGTGLYCGDAAGQVVKIYAVHKGDTADRLGDIEWRLMLGDTLSSPVLTVGKTAYVITEIGELHAIDDEEGHYIWPTAAKRIKEVLAVTKTRIYCRSLTDRLLILDVATGNVLAETGPSTIGTTVQNTLNDRIYVVSASGRVQALREVGKAKAVPTFHEPVPPPMTETAPNGKKPAAPVAPTAPAGNPNDPFGAATAAAPAGPDPFGADPAGAAPAASAPAAGADPFGADPFK